MEKSFASGELDPLADVALAWKSVQEAKAVLQRIENKFYHQTWSGAKSLAARRKLWHGKSFDGERNKDETALGEKKSNDIPPACRKGSPAALSPAWSQTCLSESPAMISGPSRMISLCLREASCSAPSSPPRNWAVDGEGTAGTWDPAKSLDRARRDTFGDQAASGAHRVQKETPACSLHCPPHSPAGSRSFLAVPCGSWTTTPMPTALLPPPHHPSPASRASDQKLEELWKKSPQNKLEQLKKRIQEQKRKQQAAPWEQKHLISAKEPPPKRALKRKVCRVGSAPPAPAYRDHRERSSAQRIQTQSQRQPPPKSSVLERAGAGKGAKLPGASAWREGQKLARKLLGAAPEFPHLRSTAEEQSTANPFGPGRGFEAIPAMENSWRDKGSESVGRSPELQNCKAMERGNNAATEDTNQTLRNLHLQSRDGNRHTRLPRDVVKGKGSLGIDLQQSLGIHSPSPGLWGITPSAFSGEGIQPSLMTDGAKPSTPGSCSREKSASPQRQKGLSSPAQRASEKENLKHPSKRRANLKKPHPYSPEIVREFMHRKKEERKQKLLEEKKSLVEAAEMRKKRLQEVYRKQKEAVGKRSCPDQVHKLMGKTASAKGHPQCDPEQEQTSGGILGRSSMAWLEETPCPLLHKDHRGRNHVLGTAQCSKKGEALAPPAPLECECWFLSPLKCEDLRDCSPPALHSPPLGFSPPQNDAKPFSHDLISGLSPYRSKWDRVKAIHSLSKELEEKIGTATKRLSAASWVKDSADKTTQTTLDLYNESSTVPEPETSRDKQDRTKTVQMFLDVVDPDVLRVSSSREFHGLDRVRFVGSTEGATALDGQKEMPTPLPGGSSERKESLWITPSTGQRHLGMGGDLSDTLQGFPVSKGSEVDISLLHGEPITSPACPAHRFLSRRSGRALPSHGGEGQSQSPSRGRTSLQKHLPLENKSPEPWKIKHDLDRHYQRKDICAANWPPRPQRPAQREDEELVLWDPASPQRGLTAQGDLYRCRTILKVQDQEEKTKQCPGESLRIPDSLSFQPSAALGTGAGTDGFEQHLGEGDCSCTELEEKHRICLDTLRQTSLLLAHKLKLHQLQQKQQLMVLREKAKQEVRESQRFLSDLLQPSSEECRSSRASAPSVPGLYHTEQPRRGHQLGGDCAAGSNQEMCSLKQPALKTERAHSPVNPKTVGERKSVGGKGSCCSVLQEGFLPADPGEPLPSHQALDLLLPLVTHVGDNSNCWGSVAIPFSGGSGTSCRLSLALAEQCLRGEELQARHQHTLLELCKKALREKARAELAWLGHQRRVLENLQDSNGASAMAAKQCKLLLELKQEQAEIQHLQNIYRAAHQERKLLLKQQREILMMQHSTAQLQKKLHHLAGKGEVVKSQSLDVLLPRSPATEEAIKLKEMRLVSDPKPCSSSAESAAPPERPELAGRKESCVQLKHKQKKKHEGFSTENKETQQQKQAEESPGLEQSLGVQGPDTHGMVAKKVCGATGGTTGSVLMAKDCKTTGLTAQDNVLLPLAHANSSRKDELISTPVPREGRKCAFLESGLEEKAFLSETMVDSKDNEDVNPCGSKFTGKGLWVLSTWCNLCLFQAENTSEGTVKVEVPVPSEIHQVDDSQPLQHLDNVSQEASDELDLKAFSEGLASTESSSKSNNFSLKCESATSDSSLPEFQKVSAVQIDISESSISDSEWELKHGEDTDVSVPEEFVHDSSDVFPNLSKEVPIAISNGKETSSADEHEDDRAEISSGSQEYPGDVLGHGCTDHLLSFLPTDKAIPSKTKPAHSPQPDSPDGGMDEPLLGASGSNSRNKSCSQEVTKQGHDAAASSSCSDDIYSPEVYEQQKHNAITNRGKKDGEANSSFMDQSRDLMGFSHQDLVTDQLRNTVFLQPEKDTANNKLLACLSPRDLSISGEENNHRQLLDKTLALSKSSKIVSLPMSMPGISEEVHTETDLLESLPRVAKGNQNKQPTTERQAVKDRRRELFSSACSKRELFQAENCSPKGGEDDATSISGKGLPPTAEDALSEILSPVDDVLSYGSADLPSSSKKDLSFPSEDLPPPPLSAGAMKTDDPTFSMDDFPSPPEQMTGSDTSQGMDVDTSLKMDVLPPLPDNIVPGEFPLLNQETIDDFSTQGGHLSEQSSLQAISSSKEDLSEHQQGERETPLQHLELLPVTNPVSSGQASKKPDFPMQQSKTYLMLPSTKWDSDDPLLSFEIGDRVLVRQTQPGTLMFKGQTHFDSGHWAGVALDKAEGDHAGTYEGVKYFECAQHCGVFVRPDEISHLLGDNKKGSSYSGDEDFDSYDDESSKGDCKYSEDDDQRVGFTEEKAEDTKSSGGSEVKENQSRLHTALSEEEQKFPHSNQYKCNEFLCQKNLLCLGSDKEKTELAQMKQRILAAVLPMKSKTNNTDEVNTSKTICCLVEDQKRIKLADDIASELGKKLLFDILIAFSETAQHKYKSAFEKHAMNYSKGLRQGDSQELFLLKENSVPVLSEPSAKVSDVSLGDFDTLCIHGCHTVAERIVTKFIDDAVKEYKKIKRKHGSKADKILHLSSETSPNALPFLIKILDAGVFGSSEDFVQPNSDQHMLVRQRQKQCLYKLDQWCSAPWKKTVEVPLVIPHYSSYVKNLSSHVVEELWTPENINSNFNSVDVPQYFECNDLPGNDLEAESKRMYNQVIFDLTHELCAEYQVTANPDVFPWVKRNVGSRCSRCFCRRADVSDVKTFIQGEMIKIMNLEKDDLEMKRKFLNMTKYGNCKRDRVDLILVQELRKEESQWTYYGDDELTVKMRMTEGIFDTLILDTIRVLNKIYLRKACD